MYYEDINDNYVNKFNFLHNVEEDVIFQNNQKQITISHCKNSFYQYFLFKNIKTNIDDEEGSTKLLIDILLKFLTILHANNISYNFLINDGNLFLFPRRSYEECQSGFSFMQFMGIRRFHDKEDYLKFNIDDFITETLNIQYKEDLHVYQLLKNELLNNINILYTK
jgi:hypothetical protein